MTGYLQNIEAATMANTAFRRVVYTGQHAQLVLMCLQPNEAIGEEVHATVDQFLRIEAGEGKLVMDGEEHPIKDGDAIVVPAGTRHNVMNVSADKPLQLYTLYSPPHHRSATVHQTKRDAEADTEDHL